MKKVLFLLIITILLFSALGCSPNENTPFSHSKKIEEESISYSIDKIVLSKGFQSIEPNVEVLKKNSNLKLLASLGLVESSGVEIEKITRLGKNINIYINRFLEGDNIQLAVPQVLIELNDPIIENIEEVNFNIINKNYEPIALKLGKNQVLNQIYSQFKIAPSTMPTVTLTKLRDNITWDISFHNIFDKKNSTFPLVNLSVKVDALTGKILDSKQDTISKYIDDGYLLDYIPHNYLLYKQEDDEKNNSYESLWTYDIENGERSKIYTSKDKIQSAIFSPDYKYIALIKVGEDRSDLYIISRSDKVAHKITPIRYIYPKLMKWKDENTLYFVNTDGDKSTLLSYDINQGTSKVEFDLHMNIEDFDSAHDKFIFTEGDENSLNKRIYITEDGIDLKEIDKGFKAAFLNNSNIIYLKNLENEDKNILHVYNIENGYKNNNFNSDVTNYFKLNDQNIIFIEKNTCNNDYTLNRYNLIEDLTTPIANITSDRIFYDSDKERGYITLTPPSENKKSVIYSIDLKKLKGPF